MRTVSKAVCLAVLLGGSAAVAQEAAEERGISLADQPVAQRHSSLSAGSGGVLFMITQMAIGALNGGFVGAISGAPQKEYLGWFLGGALVFGAASGWFQYVHPIGKATAALSAFGASSGLLAGLGLLIASKITSPFLAVALLTLAMEAGALAPVFAAWGQPDLTSGDAMLSGSASIYAFTLTGLAIVYMRASGNLIDPVLPMLLAPAAGMALGGLLSMAFDLSPGRVFALTAVPLAVGSVLFLSGILLTNDLAVSSGTTLLGMLLTVGVTALFTSPATELPGTMVAAPVAIPAGRRGEELAVGPGFAIAW
jgi:hypothetical protein